MSRSRHYVSKPVGPPPKAISEAVSRSMRSNKGFGTKLEVALGKQLRKKLVKSDLPGSPEFVYPKAKLVVFAFGCFWHRCPLCNLPMPRTHRAYWERKFARNIEHDLLVREELEAMGWRVAEVWEHEVNEYPRLVVARIRQLVREEERRQASTVRQRLG